MTTKHRVYGCLAIAIAILAASAMSAASAAAVEQDAGRLQSASLHHSNSRADFGYVEVREGAHMFWCGKLLHAASLPLHTLRSSLHSSRQARVSRQALHGKQILPATARNNPHLDQQRCSGVVSPLPVAGWCLTITCNAKGRTRMCVSAGC